MITAPKDISTVAKLREHLATLEVNWTSQDEVFLGRFEDQPINVWTKQGYIPAVAIPDSHFTASIMIDGIASK